MRWWIVQWLAAYNEALAAWFMQNYGPAIFPVLGEITKGVHVLTEQHAAEEAARRHDEAFQRWEQELEDSGE
ncbi:hypothetical protein BST11_25490 [Mycobacterium alsense]|uniref:Uncharacterized protein n=1 Tax=Mycobacterium alsense TaxID=324058 RepID=A0ABX3R1X0_9MYCO|nr:hypothetical protein BST11_25490 [Mycobacterium alsense]